MPTSTSPMATTQARPVDVARVHAFEALLARTDAADLRGRGHRITQSGAHDRMVHLWLPSARVWMAERLVKAIGPANGWKPAERGQGPMRSGRPEMRRMA